MKNSNETKSSGTNSAYINLIKDFRYLMSQMAYLTKAYFTAVFSGYGNADAIANRLYDLPNSFKVKAELVFGKQLSEEFLNLMSLHIVYLQSLAHALMSGDQTTANYTTKQLYGNAEDMAAQYGKVNPFWNEKQWKTLLYNYTGMLIQYAVALASKDFEKDLDIFDRMLLSALLIGDYQADGFMQYVSAAEADV